MEKAGRKDESKWVHGGGTEAQWKRRFREKKGEDLWYRGNNKNGSALRDVVL